MKAALLKLDEQNVVGPDNPSPCLLTLAQRYSLEEKTAMATHMNAILSSIVSWDSK